MAIINYYYYSVRRLGVMRHARKRRQGGGGGDAYEIRLIRLDRTSRSLLLACRCDDNLHCPGAHIIIYFLVGRVRWVGTGCVCVRPGSINNYIRKSRRASDATQTGRRPRIHRLPRGKGSRATTDGLMISRAHVPPTTRLRRAVQKIK